MFDQIEAYSGSLAENDINGLKGSIKAAPETAAEILEAAREEAAEILKNAQAEAQAQREAMLADAEAEARHLVGKKVTEAGAGLGLELWTSRLAINEVVSQALENMLGEIGEQRAQHLAVENAIRKYCDGRQISIRANRRNAERLQLIALGARSSMASRSIKIEIDPGLSDDSCILDTGKAQYEVGLASQIESFRNLFAKDRREHLAHLASNGGGFSE